MIGAAGEDIGQGVRAGKASGKVWPVLCPKRTYQRVAMFFADLAGLIAMAVIEPWLRMHVEAPFVWERARETDGSYDRRVAIRVGSREVATTIYEADIGARADRGDFKTYSSSSKDAIDRNLTSNASL